MDYSLQVDSGVTVVQLQGPIDVARSFDLRDLLGQLIERPDARILLDLSGVTLIDSSGVGVLVTAHRRADAAGAGFGLAAPTEPVGRVFELTRTNKLLRIFPTVEEGAGALGGGE